MRQNLCHRKDIICLQIYAFSKYYFMSKRVRDFDHSQLGSEIHILHTEKENNIVKTENVNSTALRETTSNMYTCNLCWKRFKTAKNLRMHGKTHSTDRPYKCETCEKTFKTKQYLKQHGLLVHSGEKPHIHVCNKCNKAFACKSTLTSHVYRHSIGRIQSSRVSAREFSVSQLENEEKNCTEKEYVGGPSPSVTKTKKHVCNHCQMFKTASRLKEHSVMHSSDRPYECDTCSKQFKTACTLKLHNAVHSTDRPYKYDICEKTYKTKTILKQHTLLVYSGIKEHICDVCSKAFALKGSLITHMKVHSETYQRDFIQKQTESTKYICNFCGRDCLKKSNLKSHIATYSSIRPFECQFCTKSIKTKPALNQHKIIHTDEKRFSCSFCQKLFLRKNELTAHTIIHTEGRQHICSRCGAAFYNEAHLKLHEQRHSDDRPHACEICTKSFKTKSELKLHMENHTTVKAYVCETCGKRYKTIRALQTHTDSHTGKLFSCHTCQKSFRSYLNLYKRKLIAHSASNPQTYGTCGKTFRTQYHLKRHVIVHSDTYCKKCSRQFSDQSSLTKHLLSNSGDRKHYSSKKHYCNICGKYFARVENLRGHKMRYHV